MYRMRQPTVTEYNIMVMVWTGGLVSSGKAYWGIGPQVDEMWPGTPSSLRSRKGGREEWMKSGISGIPEAQPCPSLSSYNKPWPPLIGAVLRCYKQLAPCFLISVRRQHSYGLSQMRVTQQVWFLWAQGTPWPG